MKQATPNEMLGGKRVLFRLVERRDALKVSQAESHGAYRFHREVRCGSPDRPSDSVGRR